MLNLFTPGCIGTCWCGNYHYMEPWVGCEHDCLYCYARFRSEVTETLAAKNTTFERPVTLYPEGELIDRIRREARSGQIKMLKLSRYTDFFSPSFVENGLSHEILKSLVDTPVERVIITTKGLPSSETLELIAHHPRSFSFNLAAKPPVETSELSAEPNLLPLEERLEAAAHLKSRGVLTTIHMDPVLIGTDDEPSRLENFLHHIKGMGLDRVMFSYLLLTPSIARHLTEKLPGFERLFEAYETVPSIEILPHQEETVSVPPRPARKDESVDRISRLLKALDFEFVLCSLKSARDKEETLTVPAGQCPRCDGKFYA